MRLIVVCLAFVPALLFAAPPEVTVGKPVQREVTDAADFTGRAESSTTVEIRSRVTGVLDKVLFREGADVKKGDLLFQLDDRAQKAELAKAEAEVTRAQARLKGAELDRQRAAGLLDRKAVAREEVERAEAAVEEARAGVQVAKAGLEVAKLNLEYTRIASPITGRIGRVAVDPGNLVRGDGDKESVLATVVVLDRLRVAFDVDERTVLRVLRDARERPGATPMQTVGLGFSHEEGYPRKAEIDFTDNRLDPETGTLRMRATVPNSKGELRPGMFVRVRVSLGGPRKALLVPDDALVPTIGRPVVLVVTDKNSLEERAVRPGQLIGGLRVIEEGVGADDWVVWKPWGRKAGDEVKPRREAAPPASTRPEGLRFGTGESRPLPEFPGTGPALVISATYPGANAMTVEQTVAAPIDAQLNGLEGALHRFVACSDDGEMRVTVTFPKGTDLDKAMIQAQKRVAIAEPALPDLVRRVGVTIKKRPTYLLTLALTSPDESHDRAFLAGYASARLRDELARVSGVADATFYGDPTPGPHVRLQIDSRKLEALGLTAADVTNAVREDQARAAGIPGIRVTISPADRLSGLEKLGHLVIKTKGGQVVYLRDVAAVELESGLSTATGLDGKPCVLLFLSRTADADPQATAKAARSRLADLAKAFPTGVECKVIDGD